jgi:hypothetical protein
VLIYLVMIRDLKFVQIKLNEIESQWKILLVLFKDLNRKKIVQCLERLEDSLKAFEVSNFCIRKTLHFR